MNCKKSNIQLAQSTGQSENEVMSQKAVTDALQALESKINDNDNINTMCGCHEVIEGTLDTFEVPGRNGIIYIDVQTNLMYKWSASKYVLLGGGTGNSNDDNVDRVGFESVNILDDTYNKVSSIPNGESGGAINLYGKDGIQLSRASGGNSARIEIGLDSTKLPVTQETWSFSNKEGTPQQSNTVNTSYTQPVKYSCKYPLQAFRTGTRDIQLGVDSDYLSDIDISNQIIWANHDDNQTTVVGSNTYPLTIQANHPLKFVTPGNTSKLQLNLTSIGEANGIAPLNQGGRIDHQYITPHKEQWVNVKDGQSTPINFQGDNTNTMVYNVNYPLVCSALGGQNIVNIKLADDFNVNQGNTFDQIITHSLKSSGDGFTITTNTGDNIFEFDADQVTIGGSSDRVIIPGEFKTERPINAPGINSEGSAFTIVTTEGSVLDYDEGNLEIGSEGDDVYINGTVYTHNTEICGVITLINHNKVTSGNIINGGKISTSDIEKVLANKKEILAGQVTVTLRIFSDVSPAVMHNISFEENSFSGYIPFANNDTMETCKVSIDKTIQTGNNLKIEFKLIS